MVNLVPNVFPAEPTKWSEMQKYTNSATFTAPEDGWFKFIGVARSGKGGSSNEYFSQGETWVRGGGGGGAGGIVVSAFALMQGQTVTLAVGNDVTIQAQGQRATASAGADGGDANVGSYGGSGGKGGTASGGNTANQLGTSGNSGRFEIGLENGGRGSKNSYEGYSTTAGSGLPLEKNRSRYPDPSSGYIVALRGNTNLSMAQQNAYDITDNSLEIAALAQEQTGLLLNLA